MVFSTVFLVFTLLISCCFDGFSFLSLCQKKAEETKLVETQGKQSCASQLSSAEKTAEQPTFGRAGRWAFGPQGAAEGRPAGRPSECPAFNARQLVGLCCLLSCLLWRSNLKSNLIFFFLKRKRKAEYFFDFDFSIRIILESTSGSSQSLQRWRTVPITLLPCCLLMLLLHYCDIT